MLAPPFLVRMKVEEKNPTHLNAKSIDVWAQGVVALDLMMRGVGVQEYKNSLRISPNLVDGQRVGGRYLYIAKFLRSKRMTGTLKLLRPLMMKILATDPMQRPSTQEVLQDLEHTKLKNLQLFT